MTVTIDELESEFAAYESRADDGPLTVPVEEK